MPKTFLTSAHSSLEELSSPLGALITLPDNFNEFITKVRELIFQAEAIGSNFSALEFFYNTCEFIETENFLSEEEREDIDNNSILLLAEIPKEENYTTIRTGLSTMVVSSDGIYWSAFPRHTDGEYESKKITWVELGLNKELPPWYKHFDADCIFLGRYAYPGPLNDGNTTPCLDDLYFRAGEPGHLGDDSVLVRHSSEASDYSKMRTFVVKRDLEFFLKDPIRKIPTTHSPGLVEAYRRAVRKGLIKEKE